VIATDETRAFRVSRGAIYATRFLPPVLLMFLGLGMLYYGVGDPRGRVAAIALESTVLCFAMYLAVANLLPQYYSPRFLILSFGFQCLILAVIAVLGAPLSPPYHPFEVNAADAPIRSIVAMLMVPVGALIAVVASRVVGNLSGASVRSRDVEPARLSVLALAAQRRPYLVLAAVLQLLYWPAALEGAGATGYIVRVVSSALMGAPFLAGRDSKADRRLAGVWALALLVNAIIGIAAGTRSKAFIAIVLFAAGFVSALPSRRRILVGAVGMIAAIPLIQLAGALGVVRDDLGRGGLEMMKAEHVREVASALSRKMSSSDRDEAEAVNFQGFGRLLSWTNVVVPILTPETVPYRDLTGIVEEATQTFRIASLSRLTVDDLYDADLYTAPARRYGFMVTATTSVEFGLAADAWSRGGAPVVILFSAIVVLLMLFVEFGANRFNRYGAGVAMIIALPIGKAAFFDANAVSLVPMTRGIFLNTLLMAILVLLVERLRKVTRAARRRSDASVFPIAQSAAPFQS
jgi:hypothetical protein